ncbi:TonB-dependent receptor; Outer membrane receptor for ferrienterochelin and colicins [hydrothermal vent metagenome]|uniref:TonB-dependent receptor Outer membrane receptor for ferrienterochelin and colicins n=1 Tax=hydrothermal vent metagenome TaxID=652676 RepID=A0A3B0VY25_9ZZZZ
MKNKAILLTFLTAIVTTAGAQEFDSNMDNLKLDPVVIIGSTEDAQEVTGSAHVIDKTDLEKFENTDIQKVLRQVPGVSIQLEDGFGLRPNISIRGVVTERSSRITLLEDNVLIAPAPYSAPAAYYFPTTGRMSGIEVLKGPAAITQGPYTIGGAINMISTPIPQDGSGRLSFEYGEDSTWRLHGNYGESFENFGYLVETHNWQSNGFQSIDRSDTDSGLDKDDYMVKLRFNNSPQVGGVYQQFDLKFQLADESSNQSYLGLTDTDFNADPFRRYGASELDNIQTDHDQVIARYMVEFNEDVTFRATAYNNELARNWFKTEGIDTDGSANAQEFSRSSWNSVISAVNRGSGINGLSASDLQAILAGADTANGAIQIRSNSREYYSRGIQLNLDWATEIGGATHNFEFGLRWHEDEEDRLQRNSTYTQTGGQLVLSDFGLLGNAGNRIQQAEALAFHIYDRIEMGNWVFTPGLRYESIDQNRIRYETRSDRTDNPAARGIESIRDTRENNTDVFLPGLGALYKFDNGFSLVGGVHKGFTAPTNAAGVREEEAINYEAGFRFNKDMLRAEMIAFYSNYDNLLGVCTNSSGADCEIGDAFNGDAASITGLEANISYQWDLASGWSVPILVSYTYIDGEFDSDIADTEFFGDVTEGDSLPQIPENQLFAEIGLVNNDWAFYLSANYVDETCTLASCGEFETTDSAFFVDISVRFFTTSTFSVFGKIENLNEEDGILGRLPYGARPYRGRTVVIGMQMDF